MTETPMHAPESCEGEYCPFHNPSDHHMKDWPMTVRYDRYGLTERLCVHGCGHPDPDSVEWLKRGYDRDPYFFVDDPKEDPDYIFTLHGCDFCCTPPMSAVIEHVHTHDLSAEIENGHWEND